MRLPNRRNWRIAHDRVQRVATREAEEHSDMAAGCLFAHYLVVLAISVGVFFALLGMDVPFAIALILAMAAFALPFIIEKGATRKKWP